MPVPARAGEARSRAVAEALQHAFIGVSPGGGIVGRNSYAEALLGGMTPRVTGAQIAVAPGARPDLAAAIDVERIVQVMTRLLSNAIEFAPVGAWNR